MKVCNFCGNKNFKSTKVQYTYKHSDKFLIVEGVPYKQCEFCGEQYYKGDVLKQIEKKFDAIYLKNKKVKKKILIPVEQFAEVSSSK